MFSQRNLDYFSREISAPKKSSTLCTAIYTTPHTGKDYRKPFATAMSQMYSPTGKSSASNSDHHSKLRAQKKGAQRPFHFLNFKN